MALATNTVSEDTHAKTWEKVRETLRAEYGEATFKSWLKSLDFAGVRNGQVMLTVPTRFIREWIIAHYSETIKRLWCREFPTVKAVDIFVKPVVNEREEEYDAREAKAGYAASASPSSHYGQPKKAGYNINTSAIADKARSSGVEDISNSFDSRFTFDSFVVGKSNQLAFAAAKRVADSSGTAQGCNPLYIYGGVGLGKTHLMHAIAQQITENNSEAKVLYLSAEKFMYQFVKALRQKDTVSFKEQFHKIDVLLIDDVQFISGKESIQEEFFHTFNTMIDQKHQVIISGDRAPSELDGVDDRMKSRLGWGLVVDIQPTTYDLRLGILEAKCAQLKASVPQKVLEFLAQKITSNVRELEGALNRIAAHANLVGRPITVENTQEVLHDLLKANDKKVTIEDIQRKVSEHYNIKIADLHSARRSRAIARPRQVAMYLSKKLTTKSLPEIGRKFGGKDHTTVIHAVKKIEELCRGDSSFADEVEIISKMLQN